MHKNFNQDDIYRLLDALRTHYTISEDPTGSHYCGLQIDWNYYKQYVDISIPGYIAKALQKFQHPTPKKPQYAPHAWITPTYEKKGNLHSPQKRYQYLVKIVPNDSNQSPAHSNITQRLLILL